MIESLDNIDKQLMLLINYDGGRFLDTFWYDYSYKWTWIPAAIALVWLLFRTRLNNREFIADVLLIALVVTLCDQLSSHLIKPLVCRPRPSHAEDLEGLIHLVNGYRSGQYGFVSSHAANAWGLLMYLWMRLDSRPLRYIMLAWTILTCYSRMYLGVHYPGDIIGGTIVGVAVGYVVTHWLHDYVAHYYVRRRADVIIAPTVLHDQSYIPITTILITIIGITIHSIIL